MSFVYVHSPCCICHMITSYNARYVPSLRFPDGTRQPFCKACFEEYNQRERINKGLEPHQAHPDAWQPMPEQDFYAYTYDLHPRCTKSKTQPSKQDSDAGSDDKKPQ